MNSPSSLKMRGMGSKVNSQSIAKPATTKKEKKTVLVLDVSYMAHRLYYGMPQLSHNGIGTSVLYGFFREVESLKNLFLATQVCYCFDHTHEVNVRRELYDGYKAKRRLETIHQDGRRQELEEIKKQIALLRDKYLAELGIKNIYFQKGFEADDMIAGLCKTIPQKDRTAVIIISGDSDLYQCLCSDVFFYDPRKKVSYTKDSFLKDWGITPDLWTRAIAIAGCPTDQVPGVVGVQEKTAIKYIHNQLKPGKKLIDIINWMNDPEGFERSLRLVSLPFQKIDIHLPIREEVNIDKWNALMNELGITSLSKGRSRGFTIKGLT